ncbi:MULTISPECIES: sugar ABC transporter ATP-binding protein [Bacteria]|uniref:sugar ABC transporter ATP-binding protein n=1 Tax=Bacteria TaxID=2 RepID=UPI003C7E29DD
MTIEPGSTPATTAARLEAVGVGMVFDTNRVLDEVSMRVLPGEVVGLIGENGAGKSTLMDILCGALRPTDGEVRVDGRPVAFSSLMDGAASGVFRVFQEQSLVARLPVSVNLCLGAEQRFSRAGVFQRRRARDHARRVMADLGLDIDVDRTVASYTFGERQLLEIARAVSLSRIFGAASPVILLDEPTAALAGHELELFFRLLGSLRDEGASFVFVSHRLPELLSHSDRLYVMKDGGLVAEVGPETSEAELHRLMVGRERAEDMYRKDRQCGPGETIRLTARGLAAPGLEELDLEVRAGEIVGIGGLLGSGKSQLAASLFGATAASGTVEVDGQRVRRGVRAHVAAGMAYIPLHRHAEGASLGMSITENVNEVTLGRGSLARMRNGRAERSAAAEWSDRLRVRRRALEQPVRTLSGGNQQKVVFAKWLREGAEVIVADNPTRGVDAGAKEEIYELLRDLTDQGAAVVLVSDDLLELIGLSDRILVLHDGAVAGEVESPPSAPAREEEVVALMV